MIHAHWQDSAVSVIPRWHRSGAMEHKSTFVVMENKGNVQPTRNHLCINVWWWTALSELGGRIIIKMSSYQYMDPHVKDRTVSRPSYLKHGSHHIWEDGVYIETGPRVPRDNGCGCKQTASNRYIYSSKTTDSSSAVFLCMKPCFTELTSRSCSNLIIFLLIGIPHR